MEYEHFRANYLMPFESLHRIYIRNKGFIVYRRGTGDNIELLHIKTFKKGEGYARWLFYEMLEDLEESPPYYSIFGFTRVSNLEAQKFYGALGFDLEPVRGVYKDGRAILFSQSYETLKSNKELHENTLSRKAR